MAVNKYWMVYVGIFVPLFISILSVVLVLVLKPRPAPPTPPRKCTSDGDCQHGGTCVDGACVCTPQWTGDRCQTVAVPPTAIQAGSAKCGATPVACADTTDCGVCGGDAVFQCTDVKEGDTPFNITGKYCLPVKPMDACNRDPGTNQYNEAVAGKYMWQGWKDVETQKWTCTCEYPLFYPPAIGGDTNGACTKSAELCAFGKWHFPCKGKSCNLSAADQELLKNASPLQHGYCQCTNVPCSGNEQCASGKCRGGVCVEQRLGLNPRTGLPQCVPDACAPFGKWVETNVPPYTYGYCDCPAGTVDNGYTCVSDQPPPPESLCPNNCSNNGSCVAGGKCVCKPGYSGDACDQFTCAPDLCVDRGACVGPNTCFCDRGSSYNPTTQLCDPQVMCTPPPVVDTSTGLIKNSDKFSIHSGTSCGGGSPEQVDALCQAAGFDRGDGASACFKKTDCSTAMCDEPQCAPSVTSVVGPIPKQLAADGVTCMNPTVADVQAMCANSGYGYSNLFLVNGTYQCVQFTPLHNIQILSLNAMQGVGLQGSMCVSFDGEGEEFAKARMALDGEELVASYQIYYTAELDKVGDVGEGGAPYPTPVANKLLFLKRLVAPPTQPCAGYLYSFSDRFLSTDAMTRVTPGTPLTLFIQAFPSSRWTCMTSDLKITQCSAPYISSAHTLTLDPYKPEPGVSPFLTPQLRPDLALAMATTSGFGTFKPGANVNPDVASVLQPNAESFKLLVSPPALDSPVVQAACTAAYCVTGDNITSKKFIILAWEHLSGATLSQLGLSCSALTGAFTVKYNLVRTAQQGGMTSLVGPTQTLSTLTVNDTKVAYFIDVLPADQSQWHYTLTAYAATDAGTTYETSLCKSPEQTFTVVVDPYTEAFCRSIPAPEPGKLPPHTWMENRVCHWEAGVVPAIDYYCAVEVAGKNTTLPISQLQLGDRQGQCSRLLPRYPTVLDSDNWKGRTCDPTYQPAAPRYACLSVKFSPQLPLVVDLNQFVTIGATLNDDAELVLTPAKRINIAPPSVPYKFAVITFYLSQAAVGNVLTTVIAPGSGVLQPNTITVATPSALSMSASTVNHANQISLDVSKLTPGVINGNNVLFTLAFNARLADGAVTVQQIGFTNNAVGLQAYYARECALVPYGTMSLSDCRNMCSSGVLSVGDQTCLPESPTGSQSPQYDASPCKGLKETRLVTCHASLPFDGGQGAIGNLGDFSTRMNDMYAWYKTHQLDAGLPAVENMEMIAGTVGSPIPRTLNETDEQFAQRVWTTISGETVAGSTGYQQALALVPNKAVISCADYQPLCNLALSQPASATHARAFGCGAPCNSAGSEVLYNQYFHCGPAQQATRYGYDVSACESDDAACFTLLKPIVDGSEKTTCQTNNECGSWQRVPNTDPYNPVYTQTRTCFPSSTFEEPESPCCQCRGTYAVNRTATPFVPSCQCDPNQSCNAYLQ